LSTGASSEAWSLRVGELLARSGRAPPYRHAGVGDVVGAGDGQIALARRLRFWTVAANRNSSLAPVTPRRRRQVKPRLRFTSAKPVSIIFRWMVSLPPGEAGAGVWRPGAPAALHASPPGAPCARAHDPAKSPHHRHATHSSNSTPIVTASEMVITVQFSRGDNLTKNTPAPHPSPAASPAHESTRATAPMHAPVS
jgi:hypothetical protein